MNEQSSNAVVMIRPERFYPNPETALDNAFQGTVAEAPQSVAAKAQKEFDRAVKILSEAGVTVHVFLDTPSPEKPDAFFLTIGSRPTRTDGLRSTPCTPPPAAPSVASSLLPVCANSTAFTDVVDYSSYEGRGLYLEGTGSLVLDHIHRIAYVSLSRRADANRSSDFALISILSRSRLRALAMISDRSITPT